MLIDDPAKPEEAISDALRKRVNDWYDSTAISRLNSKQNSCVAIISQRLHEDDLIGHVLEQEHWDAVKLAAIAEHDEVHEIKALGHRRWFTRGTGEPLH